MLGRQSIAGPSFKDPNTRVKILKAIYVRGELAAIGTEWSIPTSEAHGLRSHKPPTVEILT